MKKLSFLFVILIASFTLVACGSGTSSTATPTPAPLPRVFVAEGHLVPKTNLTMVFSVAGKVDQVLVSKGEKVRSGQVLVRLADQEQALASLAGAQLEQLSAKQAYDELMRTTVLVHGQAWQAYINAQTAHAAAQRAWEALDQTAIDDAISNAQADVNARKADLVDAQKEFDKYKNLDVNNTSRKTAEDALTTAQDNYNEALRKLDEETNKRDSVHAALITTQAAEAEAKRKFENTLSGADVDNLVLLTARIKAADAQVAAAQLLMDSYEVKAPFDATIADINLMVGQQVGSGTWAVTLADFGQWYVDTSDLSELDVVKVKVGQQVEITADALPGKTMTGTVEEISLTPKTQAGDVLYTVHILLKEMDASLRWGMTLQVTFPDN
jgi:multidrug resistance efflux pump